MTMLADCTESSQLWCRLVLNPDKLLSEVTFSRDHITGDHNVIAVISGSISEEVICPHSSQACICYRFLSSS